LNTAISGDYQSWPDYRSFYIRKPRAGSSRKYRDMVNAAELLTQMGIAMRSAQGCLWETIVALLAVMTRTTAVGDV